MYVPNEGVSFVLKYPDLLNGSEVRKGLLQEFLRQTVGDSAAVNRAISRTGLIIHLVEGQRFGIHCNETTQRNIKNCPFSISSVITSLD